MAIVRITGLRSALAKMQWRRGLRAALAVGVAMFVCYLFHKPMGWAALGGFQVIVVDNGGPYRSRLANILTILIGGSLGVFLGLLAGVNLPIAVTATLLFCFAATLARVMSQPFASSSVTVLVTYIVAIGTPPHTLAYATESTLYFTLGGLWAASLSLLFWPADPFRPARIAVANVYASLAELIRLLPSTTEPEGHLAFNESLNLFRLRTETAHQTLAATPARMTSRTIRARNLTVLTETADLLLARLLRIAELGAHDPRNPLPEIAGWLTASLAPIEPALRQRPRDRGASFAPTGFLYTNLQRSLPRLEAALISPEQPSTHLVAALRDTLLYFETTYEAIRAIWTGIEPRRSPITLLESPILTNPHPPLLWFDALRANLSLRSIMFRHSLRLAVIVALDVLIAGLIRIHHQPITHSYWIAMTSLIVLQPYTGETVRRSGERVLGTVAGAALASLLAVFIHTELSLLTVISIGAFFTLALYAVDYAWYCFFLTPTIVLMVLPHFRDWHFAAVRMGMTCFGALTAVLAMLFLWPEFESLQLPRLLARCAAADAAYLRAMIAFWHTESSNRIQAERTLLAPARRLCGLAANQAEETLDHALLEPNLPLIATRDRTASLNRAALTFTTFVRRLTQTITTVAAIGTPTPSAVELIAQLAARLDAVSQALEARTLPTSSQPTDPPQADEQLLRIERQVSVLERTAAELNSALTPTTPA
ncbi:MAG TPA: FUSC family protein [Acidobacteriaceae bacterium]|nr:FUSC family protein [Acidobacteriaceae bacterium]